MAEAYIARDSFGLKAFSTVVASKGAKASTSGVAILICPQIRHTLSACGIADEPMYPSVAWLLARVQEFRKAPQALGPARRSHGSGQSKCVAPWDFWTLVSSSL
jgi:hypothetical protein